MPPPSRIGLLDIGSNTVKLLVVENQGGGTFLPIFEEAHACRLGQGISGKMLSKESMERAVNSLKYFLLQCRRHNTDTIAAVGTAALREAENAQEFVDSAAEIGIPVEIISGEEEARLSYLAVRRDPKWRDSESLVITDIGGGSTELAWGTKSESVPQRVSLPIGAVRLTEYAIKSEPPRPAQVSKARKSAAEALAGAEVMESATVLVGVGGTCSNLGSVAASAAGAPERVHGRRLSVEEIESQIKLYAELPLEQRKRIQGLDPTRADVILAGAVILREAARVVGRDSVDISVRGLRWGLLYDRYNSD